MITNGFDQSGTIPVKDKQQAMGYYKEVFGMEEVYHHMAVKLQINGKLFFEIEEVSEEQHEAYMKAISPKSPILGSWAEYETEAEARKTYERLSTEALFTEELRPLPWSPCSAMVIDKYGVRWFVSAVGHMPCSDCTKSTCEGNFSGKCRLSKWTVELYKKHGVDWYKHI